MHGSIEGNGLEMRNGVKAREMGGEVNRVNRRERCSKELNGRREIKGYKKEKKWLAGGRPRHPRTDSMTETLGKCVRGYKNKEEEAGTG